MKRLVVTLVVVLVMVAMLVGSAMPVVAQPGAPVYCGPWQQEWNVSSSGFPYFWLWRWCYSPSVLGGWYIDWAGWQWGGEPPPT